MMTRDLKSLYLGNKQLFTAWILITVCFVLWGFANNVTAPMVNTFSKLFRISTTEASLVQVAYNLGYFCMAFPAAIFIQRYSYKKGIICGLAIFAIGALFFLPARLIGAFYPFLSAYFVLTCGLSFLETSCNPYIYSLGSRETATQRLNGAQAFNALGALAGMLVAIYLQKRLITASASERMTMPLKQFETILDHDLNVLIQPYILITSLLAILIVLFLILRLPADNNVSQTSDTFARLNALLHNRGYREGVIAEFFYIATQVACWTFIIQHGVRIFMAEEMTEQAAESLAEKFNIAAIVCFAACRFLCTWLMRWFLPSRMLSTLGIIAMTALLGVVLFTDRNGMYCLVLANACLSMMFPTIYGIALKDVGDNIKIAGAGLTMALLSGAFFPPIQAAIIESGYTIWGLSSSNLSFLLPLLCMAVVVWYGHRSWIRFHVKPDAQVPVADADDDDMLDTPIILE